MEDAYLRDTSLVGFVADMYCIFVYSFSDCILNLSIIIGGGLTYVIIPNFFLLVG